MQVIPIHTNPDTYRFLVWAYDHGCQLNVKVSLEAAFRDCLVKSLPLGMHDFASRRAAEPQ